MGTKPGLSAPDHAPFTVLTAAPIDLRAIEIDRDLIARFPARSLFEAVAIPLDRDPHRVRIAIADVSNFTALDELSMFSGFLLEPIEGDATQIRELLRQTLGVGAGSVTQNSTDEPANAGVSVEPTLDASGNATIVRFTRDLIQDAWQLGASDIHLEPERESLSIRFRIDGVLRSIKVPSELHGQREAVISRLKIMARLNIAEKRLPQDGGFRFPLAGNEIDIRASIIPMRHGEGIVLRLLDRSRNNFSLDNIGFTPQLKENWQKSIRRSSGMVLVTGPTGSGKTTTLYGSVAAIRSPELKIITIEDPIEYEVAGVNQIQVQPAIGLSFAAGLRSVLRHDPDVILIGEIRDQETAANAVQAALTGHLVFSTLHTNNAASAVTRLVDMGVEPFLVAATLQGVLAQRLVRRLCMHCRTPVALGSLELPKGFTMSQDSPIYTAKGCRECHEIGYQGQLAIFEYLDFDAKARQLCAAGAPPATLQELAVANGMVTLREAGWEQVKLGQTTIDEVLRVASDEF